IPAMRLNAAAPTLPADPISPATDPTAEDGKISAARVCRIVDQNWWPNKARLNTAIAMGRGTLVVNAAIGTMAAPIARVILRDRLRESPLRIKAPLNHPPTRGPKPEIAKGIQARYPIFAISR